MKTIRLYVLGAFGLAILLALVAYATSEREGFVGNLTLNLVAEFVGLSVGFAIAFKIAKGLAGEKLKEIAPSILGLIKQLREDKTVTGEAARAAVVCAVRLISEESVPEGGLATDKGESVGCGVCGLPVQCSPSTRRCVHCNLPDKVWRKP